MKNYGLIPAGLYKLSQGKSCQKNADKHLHKGPPSFALLLKLPPTPNSSKPCPKLSSCPHTPSKPCPKAPIDLKTLQSLTQGPYTSQRLPNNPQALSQNSHRPSVTPGPASGIAGVISGSGGLPKTSAAPTAGPGSGDTRLLPSARPAWPLSVPARGSGELAPCRGAGAVLRCSPACSPPPPPPERAAALLPPAGASPAGRRAQAPCAGSALPRGRMRSAARRAPRGPALGRAVQ